MQNTRLVGHARHLEVGPQRRGLAGSVARVDGLWTYRSVHTSLVHSRVTPTEANREPGVVCVCVSAALDRVDLWMFGRGVAGSFHPGGVAELEAEHSGDLGGCPP